MERSWSKIAFNCKTNLFRSLERLTILQNLKYYSFRGIVFLTFTILKILRNYRSFSFKDIVESIRSFFLLLDFLLPLSYTWYFVPLYLHYYSTGIFFSTFLSSVFFFLILYCIYAAAAFVRWTFRNVRTFFFFVTRISSFLTPHIVLFSQYFWTTSCNFWIIPLSGTLHLVLRITTFFLLWNLISVFLPSFPP